MLYIMLFTTLLPTFVHIWAGVQALLTHKSNGYHLAAETLEALITEVPEGQEPSVDVISNTIAPLKRRIKRVQGFGALWALFVIILVMIATYLLIFGLISLWPAPEAFPIA